MVKENGTYTIRPKNETHLKSSSLILAYRVLEFGIRTTPINRKTLYREALVRLHIRLINTKTGRISVAKNIASVSQDEISNELNKFYNDFHYNSFKNKFPLDTNMEEKWEF